MHPWLVPAISDALGGQAAERVIDRTLRAHRELSAEQRRAVVEAIFGVALWRRRLAFHVRTEEPASLLFALVHGFGLLDPSTSLELTGLSRAPQLRTDEPLDLATRHSLPDWLADLLERQLGPAAADAFCRTLAVPAPVFFRVNRLLTDREALAARLRSEGVETRPTQHSRLGLEVVGPRPNVLGLASHREGLFEVQDEGSQLLGLLTGALPGETVLDFCAGAGGKALLLAGEVGARGKVLCHDTDRARLERLRTRADKANARNVHVLHQLPDPKASQVDRVLVDAPCSELGTLRRGPDLRWRIDPSTFASLEQTQRDILERAQHFVRPGGTLTYATCTFRVEENEHVARSFESAHPDFERIPPPAEAPPDSVKERAVHLLPHLHGTDAFFAVSYRRRD